MCRLFLGVLLLGIGLPRLVAQEAPPAEGRLSVLRTLTISPGETARDAVCLLCSVVVRGSVDEDAVSVWGSVEVAGHVGADAVAVGGGVRIDSDGSVGADVVALGGPVEAPPGLLAEEPTSLPWLHFSGQREVFAVGATVFLLAHLLIALGVGLLLGERRLLISWGLVTRREASRGRAESREISIVSPYHLATNRQGAQPSSEVLRYYDLGLEQGRLDEDYFPLERARTRELILRHLPSAPGVVLDVGGAAGAYSFWLAERGYEVHLVDPSALHVEQAEEASRGREIGLR